MAAEELVFALDVVLELDAASVAALVPPPSSEDGDDQVEGIVTKIDLIDYLSGRLK